MKHLILWLYIIISGTLLYAQSEQTLNTKLLEAIKAHDISKVDLLLKEGADVDFVHPENFTPLMYSAVNGTEEMNTLLLKSGANVNIKLHGYTPTMLTWALQDKSLRLLNFCKQLISNGADINLTIRGFNALSQAIEYNNEEIVQLLLNKDVNLSTPKNNISYLMLASQYSTPKIVEMLLAKKIDPNEVDKDGKTALVYTKNEAIMDTLIKYGANVNFQNEQGWSALMFASYDGEADQVQLLLSKNADVNLKNNNQESALMLAGGLGVYFDTKNEPCEEQTPDVLQQNRYKVGEILIKNKANIDDQDRYGVTPLMISSNRGYTQLVQLLLASNANANKQSKDGWTPLMFAVGGCNKAVVEILLPKTNLKLQNYAKQTALDIAKSEHYDEIVQLLKTFKGKLPQSHK